MRSPESRLWMLRDGSLVSVSAMSMPMIMSALRDVGRTEDPDGWREVFRKEVEHRGDTLPFGLAATVV